MANESEIVEKIKSFKEQNSPNFKKYMDFYKEKFPEFYESKLKILMEEGKKQEQAEYAGFDLSKKPEAEKVEIKKETPSAEIFEDKKQLTEQPIFNVNLGKTETSSQTTNGFTHTESAAAPVKKSKAKIILIITLILVIIGSLVGAYFLLL